MSAGFDLHTLFAVLRSQFMHARKLVFGIPGRYCSWLVPAEWVRSCVVFSVSVSFHGPVRLLSPFRAGPCLLFDSLGFLSWITKARRSLSLDVREVEPGGGIKPHPISFLPAIAGYVWCEVSYCARQEDVLLNHTCHWHFMSLLVQVLT